MLASSRKIAEAVELAMPGAYLSIFHDEICITPLPEQRDDEHLHALDDALAKLGLKPSSEPNEDGHKLWYE